jgi:hypothetical protein
MERPRQPVGPFLLASDPAADRDDTEFDAQKYRGITVF